MRIRLLICLGILSNCGASAPKTKVEPVVTGPSSPLAGPQVYISTQMPSIKVCYLSGLARNADLAGKITVEMLIEPGGKVLDARTRASTMGDAGVENCVLESVRRWQFPEAADGSVTVLVYPFVFATH